MNWIVLVSEAERAQGALAAATLSRAREALDENGAVILRGVFTTSAIDRLRGEFEVQWGALQEEAFALRSQRPGPNPVIRVGEKRYEVLVTLKGAFAEPSLFANPLLCPFLTSVLDEGMRLSGVTSVVSFPGATLQHLHTDHPRLFGETGVSESLPAYAINVAAPLIDIDRDIGSTAICLGSHLWPAGRAPNPEELVAVDFLRGDCVLIDYRTLHTGLPNKSNIVRPILYMVYARNWFFDDLNHTSRPSLNMDLETFMALPDAVKPLMTRAYSAQARAAFLSASQT